jgi:TonB family protein
MPKVKPQTSPAPSQALVLPEKRKVTQKSPAPAEPTQAPQIAQAAVPSGLPTSPGRTGSSGVVSESSVTAEKADPSLSYYLAAIQTKVSSRWIEPTLQLRPGQMERVTVGFRVLRSGVVRDLHVLTPSESVFLDQSALRAVQEAVPLPPFPPLFPEETLLVRFHFEMRGE